MDSQFRSRRSSLTRPTGNEYADLLGLSKKPSGGLVHWPETGH